MFSNIAGSKRAKAVAQQQQQLDLSTLESYSPRWSPDLRLATCIAVKYAVQRCVQRSEVLAASSSAAAAVGTGADGDDAGLSPMAAVEVAKEWRDYGQKFFTATCQHLGVQEQTLPPDPIRLEDVLTAAQGRTVDGDPETLPSDYEPEYETGSDHARRYPKLALPIQGVDDKNSKQEGDEVEANERVADAEARQREIDRAFAELDLDAGSQRTRESSEESDHFTYDADAKELPEYLRQEPRASNDVAEDDASQSPAQPRTQATHGALGESVATVKRIQGVIDSAGGQEIEIAHELLLVALGLGQFRAQDGSTTLFEQDMLFGDTEVLPNPPGDEKEPQPQPSAPSAPPLPPRPRPSETAAPPAGQSEQNDALDSVRTAFSSLKTTTIAGWGKVSSAGKDLINSTGTTSTSREQGTGGPAQGGTQARQPVKPNELCHYDARARAIMFVAVTAMGILGTQVWRAEKVMAQTIFFIMTEGNRASASQHGKDLLGDLKTSGPSEGAERSAWMNQHSCSVVEREKGKASWGKYAAMGAGFVGGGLLIGLTGGLAAPLIAPALVGLTGAGFLATSGGIVLLGTLFGLGGGGLASYKVERRMRGVSSFSFAELQTEARMAGVAIPSLHATICCSGLLLDEGDQVKPWQDIFSTARDGREAFAVQCEAQLMSEAGVGLRGYMMDQLIRSGGQRAAQEVLKRTALAGLAAITLPMTVFGAASATLDGVFVRAKTRSHKAGLILAETLRNEVQGHRPVMLIGTSLGAATILSALVELAKDSEANAHLVDSVFLISAPITPSPGTLKKVRSVVQRRFVNVFSSKDMVCGVAAWLGSGISLEELRAGKLPRVIGSRAIEGVPGVENVNVSDLISSHFEVNSPDKLEPVLRRCGLMED